MSEPLLPREVRRRLAIIQHAEEVTGKVAMTCRYYGISRPTYYTCRRQGIGPPIPLTHSGITPTYVAVTKRNDAQPGPASGDRRRRTLQDARERLSLAA